MDLSPALEVLRRGGVVAAPTESSYGLLADASSSAALSNLLAIKPRGADKGQPLMAPSVAAWRQLLNAAEPLADLLAERFWPGQLTLVLRGRSGVDERVMLDGTVAVRIPGPCLAGDISRAFGRALTATSANAPGEPPCLTSDEIRAAFPDAVSSGQLWVIEGRAPGGPPSTLVKLESGRWSVLREGAIVASTIQQVLNVPATVF